MDCIDLRQLAGDRYRVRREESYRAERGDHGRADDPWLVIIPCRHGHIYPHSADRIGFASDRRGGIARAVAALPGAVIVQDGDDGINVIFPVSLFTEVARLVHPRRRRRMTPEQRAAAAERLRRYHFRPQPRAVQRG